MITTPPDERDEEDYADYHGADDEICPTCYGSGTAPDNGTNFGECEDCEGTGVIE